MRLDWRYAVHLPLDYAGFDCSVLSEFRDRLIAHQAEGRVFEQLVAQLRWKSPEHRRPSDATVSPSRTGAPFCAADALTASHRRAMRRPISAGQGFAILPLRIATNCSQAPGDGVTLTGWS